MKYPDSAPPLASSSTTQSTPRPNRVRPSVRTICLETIHKRYPYYTPRNDWEILLLSSGPYEGDPSGMHEFIDGVLTHEMTVLRAIWTSRLRSRRKCWMARPIPPEGVRLPLLGTHDVLTPLFPAQAALWRARRLRTVHPEEQVIHPTLPRLGEIQGVLPRLYVHRNG
ncbi:hypothetical protein BD413DRAFT_597996 [Trametes elegans]|nr:hypothetical protein BD413DRAFT_597996 [Trametes elegans]